MKTPRAFLLAVILTAWTGAAAAHTPFVKPDRFTVADDQPVHADAAYSTSIFEPVVGVPATSLTLITPSGSRLGLSEVDVTPTDTRLTTTLPQEGTYRLSTGELTGDVTRMVLDGRHWRALGANERPRRGARASTLQMVTLAESYVTRGTPSRGAVDMTVGRLAITPVTHPSEITVSSGFDVDLLFDDAPFAYMPFVLYEPGQSEDDMHSVFVTDEHGRAHIRFDHPGVYLAVVRYRTPAPRTARAAVFSYSTTITFEVHPDPSPVNGDVPE